MVTIAYSAGEVLVVLPNDDSNLYLYACKHNQHNNAKN